MIEFKITKKHYNTIVEQGRKNLPQEAGGFLGGKNGLISAILPIFNKHLFDKTGTFVITSEDLDRAHLFFKKNDLDYYGVYHTHPEGEAYPSEADILTGQKYHFIISYQNPKVPHFAVYKIQNKEPIQLPLLVISDNEFKSKDLHKKSGKKTGRDVTKTEEIETEELETRIQNIITNEPNTYKRMKPKEDITGDSEFSTFA